MKIRTDFVTNSSSANYTLILKFIGENGAVAAADFSVSPESACTIDGEKTGEDIYLDGSLAFVGQMVKENKDINDIIHSLCSCITIERWNSGEDEDEDEWNFMGEDEAKKIEKARKELEGKVSGDGLEYPLTIKKFKKDVKKLKLTTDQIRYVAVGNAKYGSGDSAMWIKLDIFDPYRDKYAAAETEEERKAVIEETAQFVLTEPEWQVNDNGGRFNRPLPIVWNSSPAALRRAICDALEGKNNHRNGSYWMGAAAKVQKYDVKTGEVQIRTVFYVAG